MAQFDIIMPKMGESIEEAIITKWFIKEGDVIEEDDVLLEIATDKVDSEIPSPVAGKVKKIMFKQDETVPVGTVIAIIDLGGEEASEDEKAGDLEDKQREDKGLSKKSSGRFYSPLVRKMC